MNLQHRTCGVLFDEIFICEGLYYNPLTDRVKGFEDFGENGRTDREANHCLVFMVRAIARDWKVPIAFYPDNGTCPSDTLAVLRPKVILKLHEIGLNVLYTVSDQGPTNRGAISSLQGQNIKGEYDTVYYVGGSKIIHLYDSPHLIKSVRNNLITSDLQIKKNCLAKWAHIIEFFKLDEGLCKMSKLQSKLCPIGRNKMKVSLAAQVFSESVAWTLYAFFSSDMPIRAYSSGNSGLRTSRGPKINSPKPALQKATLETRKMSYHPGDICDFPRCIV
ncbi:hypothetical protein FOCC_FOCC013710 [Frankliniella occidentalis]|nr:hypothetical protein FOCC_FOCC013710 [Frankliniella occidentalis]